MIGNLVKHWQTGASLFIVALLLTALAGESYAAPKQGQLQSAMSDSYFKEAVPQVDENGMIRWKFSDGKNLTIWIDELDTGYAWVWCEVLNFDSAPPSGLYRKMAELNDGSRWGNLSYGKAAEGTGGKVYLNYFFLMRGADGKALEEYVDKAISEQGRFHGVLKEYLP